MANEEQPNNEWKEKWKHIPRDREELARMLGERKGKESTPVFSKEEAENLSKFKSTVAAVNHAEATLANGQTALIFEVGKDGSTTRSTLTERHISQMKHDAFDLYADHLYPKDTLRIAANEIVVTEKKKAHEADALRDKKQGKQ
jgi:hypothetical protein